MWVAVGAVQMGRKSSRLTELQRRTAREQELHVLEEAKSTQCGWGALARCQLFAGLANRCLQSTWEESDIMMSLRTLTCNMAAHPLPLQGCCRTKNAWEAQSVPSVQTDQ